MIKRDPFIDCLRGFAILLVVLGHTIQYLLPVEFDRNLGFRIIYSFHMPLFFFISGLTKKINPMGAFKDYLQKRSTALLLPFLSWFILYNTLDISKIHVKFYTLIISPDTGLWFLWVLYVIDISLFLLNKVRRYFYFKAIIFWIFLVITSMSLHTNILGIGLVAKYLPFVLFGQHFNFYIKTYFLRYKLFFTLFFTTAFLLVIPFFSRTDQSKLPPIPFVKYYFNYFIGILGLLSCYGIIILNYNKMQLIQKILSNLGKISLEIYVTHFLILGQLIQILPSGCQIIFLIFPLTVLMTFLLQKLIKYCSRISLLLYGK